MKKLLPILSVLILFTAVLACRTLSGEGGGPDFPRLKSPVVPSQTGESQPAVPLPNRGNSALRYTDQYTHP